MEKIVRDGEIRTLDPIVHNLGYFLTFIMGRLPCNQVVIIPPKNPQNHRFQYDNVTVGDDMRCSSNNVHASNSNAHLLL